MIDDFQFWNEGINPITGFKNNWNNLKQKPFVKKIKYIKREEFNQDLYVETKELCKKYNIGTNHLGEKIKAAGFEKFTCFNKKWVLKEFEKELNK